MFRNPTTDLIVIVVIVLLIFGPKRLPLLGRQLGQGMREFKDGITGQSKDDEQTERPEITQVTTSPTPQTPVAPVATPVERQSADAGAPERHA